MQFNVALEAATFLARPNRFRAEVRLHADGRCVAAHCADPGRMRELLVAGCTVYVSRASNPKRKTTYDLRLVCAPGTNQPVSLDTRVPNALIAEALAEGTLDCLPGSHSWRAEVTVAHAEAGRRSRLDFCGIDGDGRTTWVEVKSVTLLEQGIARFPDAPTARGSRHLHTLTQLAGSGDRALVLFVIQRGDARCMQPHRAIDPHFSDALAAAVAGGVEVYAYACRVDLSHIVLAKSIPIQLA